jgi:hypothetical protein
MNADCTIFVQFSLTREQTPVLGWQPAPANELTLLTAWFATPSQKLEAQRKEIA